MTLHIAHQHFRHSCSSLIISPLFIPHKLPCDLSISILLLVSIQNGVCMLFVWVSMRLARSVMKHKITQDCFMPSVCAFLYQMCSLSSPVGSHVSLHLPSRSPLLKQSHLIMMKLSTLDRSAIWIKSGESCQVVSGWEEVRNAILAKYGVEKDKFDAKLCVNDATGKTKI